MMSEHDINKELQENKQSINDTADTPSPENLNKRLNSIINRIVSTEEGLSLVKFLIDKKVPVLFALDTSIAAHRTALELKDGRLMPAPNTQHIVINPLREDDLLIAALLHEARHAQQCLSGLALPDTAVPPLHLAIFTRMLEADAQSSAVLQAFKMKLAGDSSVFDAGKTIGYAEMFSTAEREYAKDPTALDDGRLHRAIFDAWFSDVDGNKHGYDEKVFNQIWPFFCAHADHGGFARQSLTVETIQRLGTVGGETTNYLALPGSVSLGTAAYTEGFAPLNMLKLLELTEHWNKQPATPQTKPPSMNM